MKISSIIEPYLKETGGLISALRSIQNQIGYLPQDTEGAVAEAFNLSRAEVKGVISFYSDFRRTPPEDVEVRLCAAEACQASGGRALQDELETTSQVGSVSYIPVYCLGLCSVAPAAQVGDVLVGYADCEKLKLAITAQREQADQ